MATTKKPAKKTTVALSAPWYTFANTIKTLFAPDPSVYVNYGEEKDGIFTVAITAESNKKLSAIQRLIGTERVMGNITVVIEYSLKDDTLKAEDFEEALKDTGYFYRAVTTTNPIMGDLTYVITTKDIIQFYNDNIEDYCGNINIIVADAVKDILNGDNVPRSLYICTKSDTEE